MTKGGASGYQLPFGFAQGRLGRDDFLVFIGDKLGLMSKNFIRVA